MALSLQAVFPIRGLVQRIGEAMARMRTVDVERTSHGGSEAFQHLDRDPVWRRIFAGYAFSIDYREERGHAYMLIDQRETDRVKKLKQPGACLHCHASVIPTYRKAGGGEVGGSA